MIRCIIIYIINETYMSLENDLEKIGLSGKEARVYLAALESGESTVQKISLKANVNRTTTYIILESLMKKGLCSTFYKDKRTFFIAESPEGLDRIFKIQKNEIVSKQNALDKIIPQLKAIYNRQEDKPIVRFFEGREGILSMSVSLMGGKKKVEPIRMIYPVDELEKIFSTHEREEAKKARLEENIKTKVLYTFRRGVKPSTKTGERIKIDEIKFPVGADIALFNGKIRMASLGGKKLTGVIIQDEAIYQTLVSLFELAWEAAKKREKTKPQIPNNTE